MKKYSKLFFYLLTALVINACAYSVSINNFPQLKTINLGTFANKTDEYILEQNLLSTLSEKINTDGRLRLVSHDPDCQLEGEILTYSDLPDKYDETERIIERKVQITFHVIFKDLTKDEIIWENRNLIISKNYAVEVGENVDLPTTEEGAQAKVFDDLFDNFIKNTLEAW